MTDLLFTKLSYARVPLAALKYSEDQPRDDHGRWTADSGAPDPAEVGRALTAWTGIDGWRIAAAAAGRPSVGPTEYPFATEERRAGFRAEFEAQARLLAAAVEHSGQPAPTLYRGTQFSGEIKVGDQIDLRLAGWSTDRALAERFATGAAIASLDAPARVAGVPMVFQLEAGARGLPVAGGLHPDEHEWLTQGRFEVTAVAPGNATLRQIVAKIAAQLFKYSDDEPRDDHGRWTGGISIGDVRQDQVEPAAGFAEMRSIRLRATGEEVGRVGRLPDTTSWTARNAAGVTIESALPDRWAATFAVIHDWNRQADIRKYSEDEPRDWHGRWTSDGGEADARGTGNPGDFLAQAERDRVPAEWKDLTVKQAAADFTAKTGIKVYLGRFNVDGRSYAGGKEIGAARGEDFKVALATIANLHEQFPQVPMGSVSLRSDIAGGQEGNSIWGRMYGMGFSAPKDIALSAAYWAGWGKGGWPYATDSGFHPDGTGNPSGIVTHEFGHCVDAYLQDTHGLDWKEAQFDLGHPYDKMTDTYGPVSRYGQTNDNEAFAEAFAQAYAPGSAPGGGHAQQAEEFRAGLAKWFSGGAK